MNPYYWLEEDLSLTPSHKAALVMFGLACAIRLLLRGLKVLARKGAEESIFRFVSNLYLFESEEIAPGVRLPWVGEMTVSDSELAALDMSGAGGGQQQQGGNGRAENDGGGGTAARNMKAGKQQQQQPFGTRGGEGRKNK